MIHNFDIQCNNFSMIDNTWWWPYAAITCSEEEGWLDDKLDLRRKCMCKKSYINATEFLNTTFLWVVTLSSLAEVNWYFGAVYYLHTYDQLSACLAYSSTQNMEAVHSSKSLVNFCRTARCNISEERQWLWVFLLLRRYYISFLQNSVYFRHNMHTNQRLITYQFISCIFAYSVELFLFSPFST
jgi:hypothetical protein